VAKFPPAIKRNIATRGNESHKRANNTAKRQADVTGMMMIKMCGIKIPAKGAAISVICVPQFRVSLFHPHARKTTRQT